MGLLITIAPYAIGYLFLSFCVALVLGRVLRTMSPAEELAEPDCTIEQHLRDRAAKASSGLATVR